MSLPLLAIAAFWNAQEPDTRALHLERAKNVRRVKKPRRVVLGLVDRFQEDERAHPKRRPSLANRIR